jgi:hypothetical protein
LLSRTSPSNLSNAYPVLCLCTYPVLCPLSRQLHGACHKNCNKNENVIVLNDGKQQFVFASTIVEKMQGTLSSCKMIPITLDTFWQQIPDCKGLEPRKRSELLTILINLSSPPKLYKS